jgi:cytochrome c553
MNARFAAMLFVAFGTVLSAGAADLEQGRAKSLGCQACHGSAGVGTAPDIPNLAGQKEGYVRAQLRAFRAGERKQEVMNAIAAQLSDADIANLAAFWTSLPAGGSTVADAAAEFRKSRMGFPAGFPQDFVRYAEEADPAAKTSKRTYVNRVALNAARAGQSLPPGSAIVVEEFAAGELTDYAAMELRAGWGDGIPEILRNGDWSYALFDAKRTLQADFNYARCLACHKPKAESSYVFGLEAIANAK